MFWHSFNDKKLCETVLWKGVNDKKFYETVKLWKGVDGLGWKLHPTSCPTSRPHQGSCHYSILSARPRLQKCSGSGYYLFRRGNYLNAFVNPPTRTYRSFKPSFKPFATNSRPSPLASVTYLDRLCGLVYIADAQAFRCLFTKVAGYPPTNFIAPVCIHSIHFLSGCTNFNFHNHVFGSLSCYNYVDFCHARYLSHSISLQLVPQPPRGAL